MIIRVINKERARIVQANKQDVKYLKARLVAEKYQPRKGGGFMGIESAIEDMRYIPCTLLKRLKGIPNLKIENASLLYNPVPKPRISEGLESFGMEYPPYRWQLHTIHMMLSLPFGQFDLSMNAGKSYINYLFTLIRAMKGYKTLVVVPMKTLAIQMFKDFKGHSEHLNQATLDQIEGGYDTDVIYYNSRRVDSNIIIGNAASLGRMCAKDKNGNYLKPEHKEFFESIDYVIFDECHSLVSDTYYKNDSGYLKVLKCCKNIKGKYGYTGTTQDEEEDPIKKLLVEKYIGCVVYKVPAKELEEAGQSATPKYHSHVIEVSQEATEHFHKKLNEYGDMVRKGRVARCINVDNFIDTVPNNIAKKKIYDKKYWLTGNPTTLKNIEKSKPKKNVDFKILKYTETIAFNYSKLYWGTSKLYRNTVLSNILSHPPKENQLVFVDNLKDLHRLGELLSEKGRDVIKFYGDVKDAERVALMERMEEGEGLILVAMYQVMAIGVSIKKIHRLHYYSSCKRALRFMQSFGRIIRKHPTIPIVHIHDWSLKLWVEPTNRKPVKETKSNTKKFGYLYNHLIHRLHTLQKRLGYGYDRIVHKTDT